MKNKIITIEGTDCSGKQSQTELLVKKFEKMGIKSKRLSFPNYESATGKIIGSCYLGKPAMGKSLFEEGAQNVPPKVASALFAADRYYNRNKLYSALEEGNVILDRYVDSNMAHQACKFLNKRKRFKMYRWLEQLEYRMFNMPKSDIKVLLYVPYAVGEALRQNRAEPLDEHERDKDYLMRAETAYLEIAKRNHYKVIHCEKDGKMRSIEDINEELMNYILKKLKRR